MTITPPPIRHFLILTLVSAFTQPLYAQKVDLEKIEGRRTCRIVFPERPKDAPKKVFLYDGKESQEVWLPSMNFSEVITLPSGEITIAITPSKITDPEMLPPEAPTIKLTKEIEDFYILVAPDRNNSILPLRMIVVNAANGRLNPGETLWFNLTDHRIFANLGQTQISVDPKGQTISRNPLPESGYYRAELTYQSQAKGKIRPITEQQWWHDSRNRHVGFIVNTGGRLPRIYFYRDFRL